MGPDMDTEAITAIDIIGTMLIPLTLGVPVAIQTLILPEVDVPAKAITVQTTQGTTVTKGQTVTTIPQVPTGTTLAEGRKIKPMVTDPAKS